ncbi:MAG: ACP S-malonyltransferase [Bacteroidetes bacterium]|nr:ACP S-malonyltransferase [Bacteroidota bacterium]
MIAYLFPGQGSQFPGMGKELYENSAAAKELFERANEILGFRITDTMFSGSEADLKQTKITQPAIFLHSVILAEEIKNSPSLMRRGMGGGAPDMVAGHSLGEFSALVANKSLTFEDALNLVLKRALAMQKACEAQPSTMAAVLGMDDKRVEEICSSITDEIVVTANYNCPGQLVISGSVKGVDLACEKLKTAGAKRAILLPVGGAFHSPLMEPARAELAEAITAARFSKPVCPVYQNVNAAPVFDPDEIKKNLIAQLTSPVRWTQTVENMIRDGAKTFIEVGPGKVLQGLVKKVNRDAEVGSA